ncbi:hypothetical protein WH52_13165 [Tenacibaculum holothuriorum]|uniref:Uncharacterized protein n=2 Tax=Tenacibaculum holothuriorum TaxID=1635173 RepID=A0A1Y2PA05_9FLAO|nr:hypothetical protein WH52_13165 [Tenacibaculum holothuriorum]
MLFLTVSLLLFNCVQDEYTRTNTVNSFNVIELNYLEFINDKDIKDNTSLLKRLTIKKQVKTNAYSKATQLSNGLTILVDKVKKIVAPNFTTWSFQTKEKLLNSSSFENFVVKKQQGVFSYYIVSYEFISPSNFGYKRVRSYSIPKTLLNLENLNVLSKGDLLTWIGNGSDGGDNSPCEGVVSTEIKACNQGGVHEVKYCCQHIGNKHGCGDTPLCDKVCEGTTKIAIIDFSNCNNSNTTDSNSNNNIPNDNVNDNQNVGAEVVTILTIAL